MKSVDARGMCGCLQAISEEESKVSVSDRKVLLVLAKADEAQGHWPRLLKGTGKMANVKVRSPLQLSMRPPPAGHTCSR